MISLDILITYLRWPHMVAPRPRYNSQLHVKCDRKYDIMLLINKLECRKYVIL